MFLGTAPATAAVCAAAAPDDTAPIALHPVKGSGRGRVSATASFIDLADFQDFCASIGWPA